MGIEAALIGGGLGLIGSSMSASAASDAANTQANANLAAAKMAADAQKFRPVGVTTRFGTSNFTVDPATGNVTNAGYTVDPTVAAMRDRLLSSAATSGMGVADATTAAQQGLFGLGSQYLAQSPQAAAQDWMTKQQALLAPSREKAWSDLATADFNRGTGGLKVAQGGNMLSANPYASALANSQALQDLQLASQATQAGMDQTKFGAGLFGTGIDVANAGYNPLKTQFGLAQTLEGAGQGALDLGLNMGGKTTQSAANAANTLYNAQTNANQVRANVPTVMGNIGSIFSGAGNNQQLVQGIANALKPNAGSAGLWDYSGAGPGMMSQGFWENPAIYDQMTQFGYV